MIIDFLSYYKIGANLFSTIHAIVLTCASIYYFYSGNEVFSKIIHFSVSYFIIDAFGLLVFMPGDDNHKITTISHHCLAIGLYISCYTSNLQYIYPKIANYMLFTEISTPFINLHHLSKHINIPKLAVAVNQFIIFSLFLTVRVIGLFGHLIYFSITTQDIYITSCIFVFLILNVYWLSLMCRMLYRLLCKEKKSP